MDIKSSYYPKQMSSQKKTEAYQLNAKCFDKPVKRNAYSKNI